MATGHQDDALARGEPAGSVPRHRASRQGELLDLPEPGERPVTMAGVVDPVARILLDSPVPHLDRTFDYVVPAAMAQEALPGTRVVVRFGEQEMRGWVWERAATTTHIGRLSPLRRVVSDLPVLPETSRRLIEAVANRSAGSDSPCPPGTPRPRMPSGTRPHVICLPGSGPRTSAAGSTMWEARSF